MAGEQSNLLLGVPHLTIFIASSPSHLQRSTTPKEAGTLENHLGWLGLAADDRGTTNTDGNFAIYSFIPIPIAHSTVP